MRPLKGQLKADGRLGKPDGFCFVDAVTLIYRLMKDGSDVELSIGQPFRRQEKVRMGNEEAIKWVNERFCSHSFEAFYDGMDGLMHVSAVPV